MSKYPVFGSLDAACMAVGVEPNGRHGSGFITANIDGDRRGKGDARIRYFPSGKGGLVWNWKANAGALFLYGYRDGARLPRAEWIALQNELRAVREREARETALRHQSVALLARQMVAAARPSHSHPYLARKGVAGFYGAPSLEIDRREAQALINAAVIPFLGGAKQRLGHLESRLLLIPLTGEGGGVMSLQLIDTKGQKTFLKGGQKKGLLWRPEGLPFQSEGVTQIALAEGIATALSVAHLYGVPCCAGIDCGNLKDAAACLRTAYPAAEILVFADRDDSGAGEAGARAAAQSMARTRLFICPEFTPEEKARFKAKTGGDHPTDYNDLMIVRGTK